MFGSMVLTIAFFPAAYLMGKTVWGLLYGKEKNHVPAWEDDILTGGILMIGLAEAAHLGALASGQSVSAARRYLCLLLLAALLFSAVFLGMRRLRGRSGQRSGPKAFFGAFRKPKTASLLLGMAVAMVLLLQLAEILFRTEVFQEADLTLETVVTFLGEDRLFGSNPLTGMTYQNGMPLRIRILCLPTLYAVLCQMTGASPELIVLRVAPFLTLMLAYMAYRSLARYLFGEERFFEILFLLLASILFWVGDAMYGLEGFGLLHGGFQGTTIRGAVLLPYLFGLCLREKWRLVLLPVLAEACIVWTLYGAGMGLLTIAAFLVITYVQKRLLGGREAGK